MNFINIYVTILIQITSKIICVKYVIFIYSFFKILFIHF